MVQLLFVPDSLGDLLLRNPITGIAVCCARATGHAAAPPSSVIKSRRFMSNTENLRLLPLIPNIDRELPLASDLLPYHDIFAVDFLRCRTLGLEAQGSDFTRCRGP